MKKSFLSTLLMGALVLGTSGVVTSCKDYDDDINNLEQRVADINSALQECKTNCQSEIAALKTQLEAANGKLTALQTQADANTAAITKAQSDIAALEARIKTAEAAIEKINEVLAGKVDKADFDKAVKEIYGKLEAVQDDLGKKIAQNAANLKTEELARAAADADLQQQLDAINTLLGKDKDGNFADYQALKDAVAKLQQQVNDLSATELKKELKKLADAVDAINAQLDVLNVLLDKQLRSLVFIPQSYYWGVEATSLRYLDFTAIKDAKWIDAMNWNVKEAKGYDDDTRYTTEAGTKVLTFAATYHMNPSSAKLDANKTKVSVESGDLKFDMSRAAAAGLSVKDWNADKGILTVNLDVKDPTLIKSVKEDQMITNFATVVNMSTTEGKDTTITSDYATLYTEKISGLKLALTNEKGGNKNLVPNAPKSAISPCEITDANATNYGHLMQTVHEAGVTFDAQVAVKWNETLDLLTLVETHYKNIKDENEKLDAATFDANFEYKFELTAFYKGQNETDESAHAAIAEDGHTLRPQAPTADGKQAAYGSEQVRAQEVGRTPVVRVTLVDKATGKIYDYGYIRVIISNTEVAPKADEAISYQGADYAYNGECTPNAWSYATKWYITEQDLYKKLGLTREEFEANYTLAGDVDDLDQFQKDKDGKFQKLDTKIGTASSVIDKENDPDGTKSSILKWEMTSEEAYAFFKANPNGGSVAIKYVSGDKTVGPDVFVEFKTGKLTGTQPSASLNLDPIKNKTVWAAKNAAETGKGLDEAHFNVKTPEDMNYVNNGDKPFEKVLAEAFVGNKIDGAKIITDLVDATANHEYAANKLTFDLQFDKTNNNKEFKGITGKTYMLVVSEDGKTLKAFVKPSNYDAKKTYPTQDVATITTGEVDAQKVVYQETEYAKDLLNYKAHNELDDNTLTAIIGIVAKNACHELPLTNNTFNVRFLRPLNITNTTADVEDAATTELQTIKLMDLMTFTDWRDAWSKDAKKNYVGFYGIKGVKVAGVEDGEKISTNPEVLTDQNGNNPMVSLQNVNGAIDFTYNETAGTLTYKNYSSTTDDFKVQIPVIVTYDWGEIPQTITVNVKHTHANAK